MEDEITLLRELRNILETGNERILYEIVPETCNCAKGKTRKVFRSPEAFQIHMLLTKLSTMRQSP